MVQFIDPGPSGLSRFLQHAQPGIDAMLERFGTRQETQRKRKTDELAEQRKIENQKATAKALGLPEAAMEPSVQAALLKEQAKDKRNQALMQRLGVRGQQGGQIPGQEPGQQGDLTDEDIIDIGIENPQVAALLQRKKDLEFKERREKTRKEEEVRKETLPLRKEIADKGRAAQQGMENKEHLLELIDRGNLNDPTYAAIAVNLPLNLGERLLSPDTTEYRSGLVDEYKDLRNIFQGQTRIKEIELLEAKTADIYLTDAQKKAVLKSRMRALEKDVIRADIAAEMEEEGFQGGYARFQNEIEKRMKGRTTGLFNRILDEQKAIIQDAENRKKIPLNASDPEAVEIMKQILNEARGDKQKAKELAKKKGYTWAGMK